MRFLTGSEFQQFTAAKRAAAIHFDAEWDGHRAMTRTSMFEAAQLLSDQVNFAEVDCDQQAALAKSIPILNVPCVVYYLDGHLVAALIGANQNVRARLERLLHGEPIGYKDGTNLT